ncbi:MAG: glycosyltransferase [Deltaproteobacteria bacterium]|nr:glycosyltransferase [Deltaproteobacteria bacterium]
MSKVLIISTMSLRTKDRVITGPAIRSLEMARALCQSGHDVVLAEPVNKPIEATADADGSGISDQPPSLEFAHWSDDTLEELCSGKDVCILSHYIAKRFLSRVKNIPTVVDLFDPELFATLACSNLYGRREAFFLDLERIRENIFAALLYGDFFVTANERQKDFLLGMLSALGRIGPGEITDHMFEVIPTGVPSTPPKYTGTPFIKEKLIPEDWQIVLWPGGIYPWFDGETAVRAFSLVAKQIERVALVFVGAHNPVSPTYSQDGFRVTKELAESSGLLGRRVFFYDWLPYDDRANMYKESDIVVLTYLDTLETKFSFRTRIVDCLWGGKPVICTEGDGLSELIDKNAAGFKVRPGDPGDVAEKIIHLLENPVLMGDMSRQASLLASTHFRWEKVIEPLSQFCHHPQSSWARLLSKTESLPKRTLYDFLRHSFLTYYQDVYAEKQTAAASEKPAVGNDNGKILDEYRQLDIFKELESGLWTKNNLPTAVDQPEHGQAYSDKEELAQKLRHQQEILHQKEAELDLNRIELDKANVRTEKIQGTLMQIYSARGWRALQVYYRAKNMVLDVLRPLVREAKGIKRHGLKGSLHQAYYRFMHHHSQPEMDPQRKYQQLTEQIPCSEETYEEARKDMALFDYYPTFSIVIPAYNTRLIHLRKTLDSILSQIYPYWELIIFDDASTKPHVFEFVSRYAERDKRIRTCRAEQNLGVAEATNRAIALAGNEFVCLMDHDDELPPLALFELAFYLQKHPHADMIYTDEVKINEDGEAIETFFKPDWSPDLLLSTMYTVHLGVFRKSILDQIGGFRPEFKISQDYDLVLRFTEKTDRIHHIPKVLYHWRKHSGSISAQEQAVEETNSASIKALTDALARRNIPGKVTVGQFFNFFRVTRRIPDRPLVTIIIPTKNKVNLLDKCLTTLTQKTEYDNYEIIIMDNESDAQTKEYLAKLPHQVISYDLPFNYSKINNLGADQARGDFLLFLNNDVEIITPYWLTALLEHACRPEVGATGAKLLYSDRTVQHAGVVLGLSHNGVAGHVYQGLTGDSPGYNGYMNVIRNYSAVTGACLMTRKALFKGFGGFEERLGTAFQDVDYCLRLGEAGYWIVYTPYACLIHHESKSRGHVLDKANEKEYMQARWGHVIKRDPFFNPHLMPF